MRSVYIYIGGNPPIESCRLGIEMGLERYFGHEVHVRRYFSGPRNGAIVGLYLEKQLSLTLPTDPIRSPHHLLRLLTPRLPNFGDSVLNKTSGVTENFKNVTNLTLLLQYSKTTYFYYSASLPFPPFLFPFLLFLFIFLQRPTASPLFPEKEGLCAKKNKKK